MPNFTVDTEKGRIHLNYDTQEELEAFLKRRFKSYEIVTRQKTDLEQLTKEIQDDPDGEFYCYGHSRTSLYYLLMHKFGKRTYSIMPNGDFSFVIRKTGAYIDNDFNIDIEQFKKVNTTRELLEEIKRNNVLYTEKVQRSTIYLQLPGIVKTRKLGKGLLITKL